MLLPPNTADPAQIPANPLSPTEMQDLLDAALARKDRPNGITDDQIRRLFAAANRRRDPAYLRMLEEGITEYRQEIQTELERDLADADKR